MLYTPLLTHISMTCSYSMKAAFTTSLMQSMIFMMASIKYQLNSDEKCLVLFLSPRFFPRVNFYGFNWYQRKQYLGGWWLEPYMLYWSWVGLLSSSRNHPSLVLAFKSFYGQGQSRRLREPSWRIHVGLWGKREAHTITGIYPAVFCYAQRVEEGDLLVFTCAELSCGIYSRFFYDYIQPSFSRSHKSDEKIWLMTMRYWALDAFRILQRRVKVKHQYDVSLREAFEEDPNNVFHSWWNTPARWLFLVLSLSLCFVFFYSIIICFLKLGHALHISASRRAFFCKVCSFLLGSGGQGCVWMGWIGHGVRGFHSPMVSSSSWT